MDNTITTGWWTCSGCGIDAELPIAATGGCEVPCPDCEDAMAEQWRWDAVAA
jgi:uncharacterized paraquat-inducible protein A